MLFDTWNRKLSKVPDETKIYPAHGAGSLCGAHLSDAPVSTFGEQKWSNPYLKHKDLASFVTAVISGLGDPPQYFGYNAAMNRQGPPAVDWSKRMPQPVTADQAAKMADKGAWLVDVRDQKAFAEGHLPGAMNIDVRGRFETWTGTMVPWGQPLILVGPDDLVREAMFRLHRIGYDAPAGYLEGGVGRWKAAGRTLQKVTLVTPLDLYRQMQEGNAPIIVDVRLPEEWMSQRIGNVVNIPLNRLFHEAKRLDPSAPVLMVCNSAYRSSLAAGIMQKLGFRDVRNLDGGSQAWIDAGLPTYGETYPRKAPGTGAYVNLPERMSPEDLSKRLMDLPESIQVVDIRPEWQYREFHIPGSVNVEVSEVMGNPAYLADKRPLVIVCRDGYVSAAVGGALVQKSPRSVRFLEGGVARYYDVIMRPKGIISDGMAPPSGEPPAAAPSPSRSGTAPSDTGGPKKAPAVKKKSAGC
jgi:rhodanese-related sulfurtransferase